MAHDQFKAFLEAVSADSSLQEKLNSAADADAVVAIAAKEAGFVISAEAVENHYKEKLEESEEELTAEQLEAVTGGAFGIGKKNQGSRNKNAADSTFRTALPMHSLWSNDGKRF